MQNQHSVQKRTGLNRLMMATVFSLRGLREAFVREAAFRQEMFLCLILIPAAFWWGSTAIERVLLVGSCLIVLITELLNSAVEAVIDRIGLESHEMSGVAKDLGSAAVFVSLGLVIFVWAMIGVERWF